MKNVWIGRLLPASVVAIVLAFSYFAPALGFAPDPVKQASHTNCGRFGYGYHGGKHLFVCPSPKNPPPAVRQAVPVTGSKEAAAAKPGTTVSQPAPASSAITKAVVDGQVAAGVKQWRAFAGLVLRQLD